MCLLRFDAPRPDALIPAPRAQIADSIDGRLPVGVRAAGPSSAFGELAGRIPTAIAPMRWRRRRCC